MTTKRKSDAMKFLDKSIGTPMTFGSVIESLRLSENKTQSAYAKKLGISQTHLSQIETGVKTVSPERAKKFAKILGYSEVSFVQLALQDLFAKLGINLKVTLEAA
jgi:transcriptional regulator with XRE-family HTH domain